MASNSSSTSSIERQPATEPGQLDSAPFANGTPHPPRQGAPTEVTVAYLVNQYPATTHTFIRREIAGLEAAGVRVQRFAIRTQSGSLVSPEDEIEQGRTRAILSVGIGGLVRALTRVTLAKPLRVARALRLAILLGRRSDRGLLRHLAYLSEACVLLKWVTACGAQHVHAHFGTNPAAVAALCRVLGGPPYSFTAHGPADIDRALLVALGEKCARAAFVVAVCEFGRAQLYRYCAPEHWSKIHVIHCGVDDGYLSTQHHPVPIGRRLICVGRLCREKGQVILIEAAGRLAAEGVAFELILVGDGPMRGEIEDAIQRLGLGERVTLLGWASGSEVQRQLLSARALVLPSFCEGLPVAIMEAFALGRPVISTYVAGIPELVEHGVNGWLVPAGSVDALVSCMREAIEAPVERLEQMGLNGARRVAEHHSAQVEARRLAALFRSSIER